MQYHEFLGKVQQQGGLNSETEATTAIRATLETFADHLAGNAPAKMAAQLPHEAAEIITNYKNDPAAEGEGFGVEEFIRRVAAKTGFENDQARKQAQAVLSVTQQAITDGEWEKLAGTFPAEYAELFGNTSSSQIGAGKTAA